MAYALVVTRNAQVSAEFRKIAAVTGVELREDTELSIESYPDAFRIYIDHEVPVEIDLRDFAAKAQLKNIDIILVLATSPNATTWQLAHEVGAQHIAILPESRQWLIENIKPPTANPGTAIAITSSVGGVGTSTLISTLASLWAKQNLKVGVVDCSRMSVGLDVAYGLDQVEGIRWSDLVNSKAEPSGKALLENLPHRDGVWLLANDELGTSSLDSHLFHIVEQLKSVCDYVILDYPLGSLTNHGSSVVEQIDSQLLMMSNSLRACAVAHTVIKQNPAMELPLVIREIPGAQLAPLSIAQSLDQPLWAAVPTDARVVEFVEQGLALEGMNVSKYNRAVMQLAERFSDAHYGVRAA